VPQAATREFATGEARAWAALYRLRLQAFPQKRQTWFGHIMGNKFVKQNSHPEFIPMNGQHLIDSGWQGVTAEITDIDSSVLNDEESGDLIRLQLPDNAGKMLRVVISGKATFYITCDGAVRLSHQL
jgi:hypothetical protein